MKVLYLIDTLDVGGTERSLCDILSNFKRVTAVVCHVYPGEALKPDYERAGLRVISLNIPGNYSFLRAIRRFDDVVKSERPDLIHSSLFRAEIIARIVARRRGIPLVASFVSDSYGSARRAGLDWSGRFKLSCVRALDAVTARFVTRFTANTAAIKGTNGKALGVPPERIEVIHRGRDIQRFAATSPEARTRARAALGIEESVPVLLKVARLLRRKGLPELLEAVASIRGRVGEVRLLIAGEGPYRKQLEQQIIDLGLQREVQLLGARKDILQLLHAADIFVFPSHFEGQPGAVIEAMLAGKPIVASDLPEHRETLIHGQTAFLVPPQNVPALADAIVELLRDREKAHRLGEAARRAAVERFDIREIARQHEALYERVLHESKPSRARPALSPK